MLERAIAKGRSVRLSVCHTRNPRLNGPRYRNIFHTIPHSDVSSFLLPNVVVVSIGVHQERVC